MPANLSAVRFWPAQRFDRQTDGGVDGDDLVFVLVSGASPVPLAFDLELTSSSVVPEYRIKPRVPLVAGARYSLRARNCDGVLAPALPTEADRDSFNPQSFALFDVAEAAPLPADLGNVTVSASKRESLQLLDLRGACSFQYTVTSVDAVLQGTTPWKDAIAFETWVDGNPYYMGSSLQGGLFGVSWVGQGRDKLVSVCDTEYSAGTLDPGPHKVQFRGTIAGVVTPIESNEVAFTLPSACESRDGGTDASVNKPDGAADASQPPWGIGDSGVPSSTGGRPSASGGASSGDVDSGSPSARAKDPDDGCSIGHRRSSSVVAWLLGAALALVVLRKRGAET